MLLKTLTLVNFRNFDSEKFEFNPHLTLIVGENARGKTNILESIYFVINGTGFRESREDELVHFEKNQCLVAGRFTNSGGDTDFQISLAKKNQGIEKIFFVNKTRKNHRYYRGEQTRAVLFSPEQLDIITDAPAVRRSYFNTLISYYDYEYKKKLDNYDSALRKRNKVLEMHRDGTRLEEELEFWNEYLINQATYITKKRMEYVEYLNSHPTIDSKKFRIEYLKNEFTRERLTEFFEEEKRWRRTIIGPQKDDFGVYLENSVSKNLMHFGARSEQRMGLVWLKINELHYYEEYAEKNHLPSPRPIILLDDIFSELDLKNKRLIFNLIKDYQSVITSADPEIVGLPKIQKSIIAI